MALNLTQAEFHRGVTGDVVALAARDGMEEMELVLLNHRKSDVTAIDFIWPQDHRYAKQGEFVQ